MNRLGRADSPAVGTEGERGLFAEFQTLEVCEDGGFLGHEGRVEGRASEGDRRRVERFLGDSRERRFSRVHELDVEPRRVGVRLRDFLTAFDGAGVDFFRHQLGTLPHRVVDNQDFRRVFAGRPAFIRVDNLLDMRPPHDAVTGRD